MPKRTINIDVRVDRHGPNAQANREKIRAAIRAIRGSKTTFPQRNTSD